MSPPDPEITRLVSLLCSLSTPAQTSHLISSPLLRLSYESFPCPAQVQTLEDGIYLTPQQRLAFFALGNQPEPALVNFYRWFVIHSIHKRSFRNGAFKDQIPWVLSGVGALRIEHILFILCESPLVTAKERAILCTFLDEYHQQLEEIARLPSGSHGPTTIASWGQVKRMFDMDDPLHIAGQSVMEHAELHDQWDSAPSRASVSTSSHETMDCPDVMSFDETKDTADVTRPVKKIITLRGKRYQDMERSKKGCSPLDAKKVSSPVTPKKTYKRHVSGSAARSTSPTKKSRAELVVSTQQL